MKIAYKHLINHIESKPNIEEISERLFQLGHEHEIENDIFDIEFTPNRGDCLSVIGLLRDLNVFYDIKFDNAKYEEEIDFFDLDFFNNAEEECQNISFLKIEIDGKFQNYKAELNDYFQLLDIKKKNFFTDISNYVSYEMGQPTHCYDFNKIKGNICLEESYLSCNFNTLLDKEIKLTGKNLVFTNNKKIINLAGVIGDKTSSCSLNTNSVIVEFASFKPETIIGKALKYGIQSDAAHKFERGVDPDCHNEALRRFIHIVKEHSNIKSLNLYTRSFKEQTKRLIKYDLNTIRQIIGFEIDKNELESYLSRLNFKVSKNTIEVPSFRWDINTQNDIAEELARCHGYNNIKPIPFKIKNINKNRSSLTLKEEMIKRLLIDNGFFEVINFPFSKVSTNSIKIDNPIDTNKPFLRENITESLIENLLFNERRQQDSIKLFEVSDIYKIEKDGKYNKQKRLSIIASGRIGKNYNNFSRKIDFNYVSSILNGYIDGNINIVKEITRDKLITKIKSKIFFIEIDLSEINEEILNYESKSESPKGFNQYMPISEFPKIYRDLSFLVSKYESMDNLNDLVIKFNNRYLKEVFIFDCYENSQTNILKIGYRFIFQANDKTLTDKDVHEILSSLIDKSQAIPGISIPGM
tara:strand:+ start:1052 stop:2965 length:1914 start_codon:yes stop_codon:yes gene_type:complete